MTGPEHYVEGERLLAESKDVSFTYDLGKSHALTGQATAHFLAALTASHATSAHPDSVAWEQAINPKEPE